jgi:hypothetical protein
MRKYNATENGKLGRRRRGLRKYNISIQEYDLILTKQNGVCRICKKSSNKSLHVDHDHKTNRIRGLLCHKCNVGLGNFNDDPILLHAAIEYLEDSA